MPLTKPNYCVEPTNCTASIWFHPLTTFVASVSFTRLVMNAVLENSAIR